jgi:dCMP deaminase
MNKISWDDYFMTMVYLAAMRSKDNSTHIGAVIVDDINIVMSMGYNSFVRGINDDVPERQERPEKYYWMEHAESNAMLNADQSLRGCRMYTNGVPCAPCARAIIQKGITEVIVDKAWDEDNKDVWVENAERSTAMFREAGVKVRQWSGKLIDIYKFRRKEKF